MKSRLRTRLLALLISLAVILLLNQTGATTSAQTIGGGEPTSDSDPSFNGPYSGITTQNYDLGSITNLPGFSNYPVELKAGIYFASDASGSPLLYNMPVVVLLHGWHYICHDGADPQPLSDDLLDWPCPTSSNNNYPNPIWSYQGYDYVGLRLASYGFLVISVSANGINAKDNHPNIPDTGMLARAGLIEQHLQKWNQWNTTGGYPGNSNRWLGRVDLTRVGLMGHSRGGEGVVRYYTYNASGSHFGVKALFLVAPTDINRVQPTGVALDVLLPYCDGDIWALEGIHYFDDTNGTSSQPSHSHLMLKSNHNYFNTVWSPNSGIPGAFDDWSEDTTRANDAHCMASARLTETQQRLSGRTYMTAFFYSYLSNDLSSQYQFYRHLTSDANPPSYVQQSGATTYVSYAPPWAPASQYKRLDINIFSNPNSLTTNLLGGSVTKNQLIYALCGDNSQTGYWCLNPYLPLYGYNLYDPRQPHQALWPGQSGLDGALHLKWASTSASLDNAIPDAAPNGFNWNDFTRWEAIQFRAGVNFQDSSNISGQNKDLRVYLVDSSGREAWVRVSDTYQSPKPSPLYFPPGTYPSSGSPSMEGIQVYPVPHMVMNTVRIPLSAFQNGFTLNLEKISNVILKFNESSGGDLVMADLSLTNSQCVVSTPVPATFQDIPTGNPFYVYIHALASANIVSGYGCGENAFEPCVCPSRNPYFRTYNELNRGQLSKMAVLAAGWNGQPNTQTFQDVAVGSTYHMWIEQLASQGYISGYPCGGAGEPCIGPNNKPYFRPYNSVKRAQVAKIISNAAGFSEQIPAGRQTFADVPPSGQDASLFYTFVERMAGRLIITGYRCGVEQGEPCDSQNRPYFRPWISTTRGQASKAVAISFCLAQGSNSPLCLGLDQSEWDKEESELDIPGALPTGQVAVPPPVPTP